MNRVMENIKNIAKSKGIFVRDIERKIGVSKGYLSRDMNMSAMNLYKISKVLGVTMEDLFEKNYQAEIIKDKIKELEKELLRLEGK